MFAAAAVRKSCSQESPNLKSGYANSPDVHIGAARIALRMARSGKFGAGAITEQ